MNLESSCPTCREVLDEASEVSGLERRPRPGDFSVCYYCGECLRFDDQLALRVAAAEDLAQLDVAQRRLVLQASRLIRGRANH